MSGDLDFPKTPSELGLVWSPSVAFIEKSRNVYFFSRCEVYECPMCYFS